MTRNTLFTSIAAVALLAGTPAFANPGGGGSVGATVGTTVGGGVGNVGTTVGGGIGGGIGVGSGGMSGATTVGGSATTHGSAGSGSMIDMRGSTNIRAHTDTIRGSSSTQTGANAHANTRLMTITSGMTVADSSGATIGTISGISTKGNGSARNVQVTLNDGTVVTVSSRNLSLNGGVLTASTLTGNGNRRVNSQGAVHASDTAKAHANEHSVILGTDTTVTTTTTTTSKKRGRR